MKTTFTITLLFFLTTFMSAQEWQTDLSKSLELAKNDNKKIVLVFQGSDWCAPCIKLDKEIWSSEVFISYAKENYVLLKADFPRRRKNQLSKEQQEKNNKLYEKYDTQGYFPFVVVLDKDSNVLGTTGYKKVSPKEYIKILNSF